MKPADPTVRPPYTYLRRGRWFWEPPPRLRGPGCKVQALGADQVVAWEVARNLNRTLAGDDQARQGSIRWVLDQFEASDKFTTKAPSTQKDYKWLGRLLSGLKVGGVALGDLPARSLRARHADKIYAEIKKANGATSAHYAARYARRVWNWGRRQEHVEDNPWAGMELPGLKQREQRWTPDQITAVIVQAGKMGWPSIGLAVRIAWRLTLREQDILGLTWSQVEERMVGTRKTGAGVPIVVKAYPDLRRALAAVGRREGVDQVVVCETTGEGWGEDYFRHVFRAIADAAGLPKDLQFRDLRATGLTELGDAGATTMGLSTHGGHATTQMQRRYVRRTPEQFEAAARMRLKAERAKTKG